MAKRVESRKCEKRPKGTKLDCHAPERQRTETRKCGEKQEGKGPPFPPGLLLFFILERGLRSCSIVRS